MNYTTIFKEALSTFWRHKSLWIFGVVITLFGQGEYSFSINYRESYPAGQGGMPSMPGSDLLIKILDNPIPYIIGLVLLNLMFWIIASLICWWSQGALISMVDDIDKNGFTSIHHGWNAGRQQALPLTMIAILFALPKVLINLPLIAGGIWFFFQFFDLYKDMLLGKTPSPAEMQALMEPIMSNIFLGFACIVPLVCVGAVLGWLLGLLNKVTVRSFVLEDLTIVDSLKRGWEITRKNLGHVLLNGIVLIVTGMIFGWVAAIPALIIWVPVARAFLHQSWTPTTIVAAIVMGFYFLFVVVGLGGILTSFNTTLWTKLYKAMAMNENTIAPNGSTS